MIANISPAQASAAETHTTLEFATRAKFIKNRASSISPDYDGPAMRFSSWFPLLLFPMLSDCSTCRKSLGDSTSGLERTSHAVLHWLHSAPSY
jgi:hypothetical protein